ncbi:MULTISPECIES: NAD(P)/FAD-dependent oxidoreductase [unclassified Streptomyces]|uniref:NAD(P)/FAD-dependent oxidoreductase n=1 Tax=unclassified Streptomyces TaxID=2593676 RepID=UPI002E805F04|nr:NAD(P)/FAD-dependent oxidoreductase [Streptomyces sp. NBC_00589]WTI35176.1 NAD(P)/FAD-dependent oxidoreductase [Streptomyces sp. NBC_00775]WUB31150.1 NAD(P)/FAD-dependent oxidoreductase [Streptomyces sp. NBC_00589]
MAPVAPSARDADTLVVGGGPAGLSAALCLARYNRRVLVFDTGHGRSTHHQVNRNYLGFPGGIPTVELRELGRAQLAGYPQARVVHHAVLHAEGDAERGFTVHAQTGSWTGRTLIIATGVLDHFPHFHGWESYVGRSMFWCIACDGYENRGKRILVVGHTDATAAEALQMHSLSDDIQLLTNSRTDEIGSRCRERLEAAGIPVLHDRIRSVEGEDGMLHTVVTRGGQHLKADSLFSIQGATPEIALARALSLRLAPSGHIAVDTEQKTSAAGVYAAGDVSSLHSHQVSAAVHEGSQAASAANYFLYPAELKAG